MIELGRLGRPFGIKGWLRCESFATPPEALWQHRRWQLRDHRGGVKTATLSEVKAHGNGWVVKLDLAETPEVAALLTGSAVMVPRGDLAAPAAGEYFEADLIGFKVRNRAGILLGKLTHYLAAPAQRIMVVRGAKEHLLPVTPQHVLRIDVAAELIDVDWPEDF